MAQATRPVAAKRVAMAAQVVRAEERPARGRSGETVGVIMAP